MSEELKVAEAAQIAGFHPATCVLLLNGKDALLYKLAQDMLAAAPKGEQA